MVFPFQTNSPVTPDGRVTSAFIPEGVESYFTSIVPLGVGTEQIT